MSPPDAGPGANYVFYIRELATYYVLAVVLMEQLCTQIGPVLPISEARIAWISLLVVTANVSFTCLLATTIGFPVPFTIQVSTPCQIVSQSVLLGFHWRHHLRANPAFYSTLPERPSSSCASPS